MTEKFVISVVRPNKGRTYLVNDVPQDVIWDSQMINAHQYDSYTQCMQVIPIVAKEGRYAKDSFFQIDKIFIV